MSAIALCRFTLLCKQLILITVFTVLIKVNAILLQTAIKPDCIHNIVLGLAQRTGILRYQISFLLLYIDTLPSSIIALLFIIMTVNSSHQLWIYDTTLRDGTQREGLSVSMEDKLRIARRLDELGIPFIEGGWPGANP